MLKPSLDRILVKRDAEDDTSSGGIYIGASTLERPKKGIVVASGSGARYVSQDGKIVTMPPLYKVGDRVLIPEHGTFEIKIDGEKLELLREHEVLGKF